MSLRLHLICIKQYRLLRGVVIFWKQNHVRMMCSVCKDWLKGESMGCVQSFALTQAFFHGQVGSISKIEKGIWRTKTIQIAIQDFRIGVGSGLGYRWFDYILCSTMTMISVYFKSICCMTILHILRDPYLPTLSPYWPTPLDISGVWIADKYSTLVVLEGDSKEATAGRSRVDPDLQNLVRGCEPSLPAASSSSSPNSLVCVAG